MKTVSCITNYNIRVGHLFVAKWVIVVYPTGSKLIPRSAEEYGECKSSRSSFTSVTQQPARIRAFDNWTRMSLFSLCSRGNRVSLFQHHRGEEMTTHPGDRLYLFRSSNSASLRLTECKLLISGSNRWIGTWP